MRRVGNPETLRAQAQELLKKAKKIEEKKYTKAGQLVYDYYTKGFAGFDLERFKVEAKEAFTVKKRGRKPKTEEAEA